MKHLKRYYRCRDLGQCSIKLWRHLTTITDRCGVEFALTKCRQT